MATSNVVNTDTGDDEDDVLEQSLLRRHERLTVERNRIEERMCLDKEDLKRVKSNLARVEQRMRAAGIPIPQRRQQAEEAAEQAAAATAGPVERAKQAAPKIWGWLKTH